MNINKKSAVVIDTSLNTQKIDRDFKELDKKTQALVNKYNKSVDSIKSQELAIAKVKNRLDELVSGSKTPNSIKNLENESKKAEKEVENLEKEYDSLIKKINEKEEHLDTEISMGDLKDDSLVSSLQTETEKLNNDSLVLAEKLENVRDKASSLKQELEKARLNPKNSTEIQELQSHLDNLNSKLSQTKDETNQVKEEIEEAFNQRKQLFNFSSGLNDVGKKIDKFKSRMTKLIVTTFVFNLLRQGLNNLRNGFISLLKTDSTFNNSLNQIKANLMTAFAPIYNAVLPAINTLMNALSKVIGTIAMFVANLFNISLEDAKKQAQGLSKALEGTSKSGKEASGALASFDKLEVINDNSGAQGSSLGSSDIDYSGEIQYSQRLLDFLNQIKDFVVENKNLILSLFTGILSSIFAIKMGCDGFKALGIGLVITGIILLIQDVINFLNDPTWEGFGKILTDIGIILLGLSVIIGSIPLAVAAAIAIIVGLVISNWETICGVLGEFGDWIYSNVIKPVADFFVGMWNRLVDGAKGAWNGIKFIFSTVASFFKEIFTNAWSGVKNVFSTGGKIFMGIVDGILSAFVAVVNTIITGINKVISLPFNGLNNILNKIHDISILGVEPFSWLTWRAPIPQLPRLATGTVIPPRHEFAAILGDQKHGTNIEAPLETIKQAQREVMQEFMGTLGNLNSKEQEIVFKNLTLIFKLGEMDLKKMVIRAIRLSEVELGKQLLVS